MAETRKHKSNYAKSSDLGWSCVPLAVETYGSWGKEAIDTFALLASCTAVTSSYARSKVTHNLYSKLNFTLFKSIARAIVVRDLRV